MHRTIASSLSLLLLIACGPAGGGDGALSGGDSTRWGAYFAGAGSDQSSAALQDADVICFYGTVNPSNPAAVIEHRLESFQEGDLVHVRLTLDPRFADNTYGAGSIGWSDRGDQREFSKLVGSDHAVLDLYDGGGELSSQVKIDYISRDETALSEHATLGVWGGDGRIQAGDEADVVRASTSLDLNLNLRGYPGYIVDSPETDENFTPNPNAPLWDYRVIYEVWVKLSAFSTAGFGYPSIDWIHASPSKLGDNTLEVLSGPCPPDWSDCSEENPERCPNTTGGGGDSGEGDDPTTGPNLPCSEENPEGCFEIE